jgi:hypothetical protein
LDRFGGDDSGESGSCDDVVCAGGGFTWGTITGIIESHARVIEAGYSGNLVGSVSGVEVTEWICDYESVFEFTCFTATATVTADS